MTQPPNLKVTFSDKFKLREELGRGAFSVVHRCVENSTGLEFAAKVVKKENMKMRELGRLESEARICRKLNHPNIVKLHQVFSEARVHYFVFDLVTGGELFDDLVRYNHYTEELTAKCMLQILDTIKYCHSMGVIHRDLKPENILLQSQEKKIIKIADFGLAVEVQPDEMRFFGLAGSPFYIAPEVLDMKPYGKPVDLWACGVIMYIMLTGDLPFYHKNEWTLNILIRTGDCDMTKEAWNSVSQEAKDMVGKLLCVVPTKRITAEQGLEHSWFKKAKGEGSRLHRQATVDKLRHFNAKRKFKAAVHTNMILHGFLTTVKKNSEVGNVSSRSSTSVSTKSGARRSTGKTSTKSGK